MKKLLILLALLMPFIVVAAEWQGTVVDVSDGDTVKIQNASGKLIKVRLVEIDAPESKQVYGQDSKESLSELCLNKSVVVNDKGTDKYKRTLGRLVCDGVDANLEQVKRGAAWAYTQYLTDPSIAAAEKEAKAAGLGLWGEDNPLPPWEFRHGSKAAKAQAQAKKESASGFECSGKSRCGDMSSCAEARFYLNECGLKKLDRDRDGIPCESICR